MKGTAVLHWKFKPMAVVAVLTVVSALVAGYFDGNFGGDGMYW